MRSLRSSALVVGSSLALASGAFAQQAVQWRVEDGGNGHWYAVDTTQSGWTAARERALARGGDLASFETAEEHAWLLPSLPVVTHGYLIGGTQGPGSAAPNTGWRWLTGSEISPALMLADDNPCGNFPPDVEDGQQDFLHWRWDAINPYGDINDGGTCFLLLQSITEWSADCNNDGIVDYGQVQAGLLADDDTNGVPDCCQSESRCVFQAVEWSIPSGGNGHWYQLDGPYFLTWESARKYAESVGGHLVTLTSASEQAFAASVAFASSPAQIDDCWIGAYQELSATDYVEPAGGWRWVTGEPWSFTAWRPDGQPKDVNGSMNVIAATTVASDLLRWVDSTSGHEPGNCQAFVEWSADCNRDGVVDFGQIRSGELLDENGNHTPDCCESAPFCNCPADVDSSGAVNGVDLAAILNTWGTTGGKYPGADINRDGTVDGADLAEVLNSWGACP